MNGNFKYALDDSQRNTLHTYLTGKDTKTLVTRKQVCEFLQGTLDAALQPAQPPEHGALRASATPAWIEEETARLRDEGHDDSYIRGWLQVMVKRSRHRIL